MTLDTPSGLTAPEPRRSSSDVSLLVDDLVAALGDAEVSVVSETLDMLSHDASAVSAVEARRGLHSNRPDVSVRVTSPDQVVSLLKIAAKHEVPITPRGLGSSVTGQPLPVSGGIVLDMGGLTSEPVLTETDRTVTVAAGCRGIDVEKWLNARDYTLNHFPQSLPVSSVGGWLATKATGQFSTRYGGIEHLVVAYTVVLADGNVVTLGAKPRSSSGPDLFSLFLGSEGSLGVIVSVTLKVFALTEHQVLESYSMPDIGAGLEAMREIMQRGVRPALARLYDSDETRRAMPGEQGAGCALFLACEGPQEIADAEAGVCREIIHKFGGRGLGSGPVHGWLDQRYDYSAVQGALSRTGGYAETIEVAHFWSEIATLYAELRRALAPLANEVFGHFSHFYPQGASLYVILLGQAPDDETAAARLNDIWRTAMEVTIACGGELSHHHGIGLVRQQFLARSLGPGHDLLRRLKHALDPSGLLSPGKLGL